MSSTAPKHYADGERVTINRGLVQQLIEPYLLQIKKMGYNQEITFSMLPQDVVVYVNDRRQAEPDDEGGKLIRKNGKKL